MTTTHLSLGSIPNPALNVVFDRPTMAPQTADLFVTLSAIVAGLVVGWALVELVRRRSPLFLFMLLGSVFCIPIEPIWDALGFLRFHKGNHMAFTMFPDMAEPVIYPWWAVFTYLFFSGLACYCFYRMFEAGVSRKTFWLFMAGQAVMNIVFEAVVITKGYDYYGDQPLRIGSDFPLWWVFANYGELAAAALLFLAVRRWGLRAAPLAIVLVPSCFGAWELFAGWPVFVTLNMDVSLVWRNIAALVTAAIAIGAMWAIERFVPRGNVESSHLRDVNSRELIS